MNRRFSVLLVFLLILVTGRAQAQNYNPVLHTVTVKAGSPSHSGRKNAVTGSNEFTATAGTASCDKCGVLSVPVMKIVPESGGYPDTSKAGIYKGKITYDQTCPAGASGHAEVPYDFTVVAVTELWWVEGDKNVTGDTYGYAPNTKFTLKAVTNPYGYGEDLLTWSGGGLAGTGFTKTINNLTADSTITVACGYSSVSATFNIASATITAEDNCPDSTGADYGCMWGRTITYIGKVVNGQSGTKTYTFSFTKPDGSTYTNPEDDSADWEDLDYAHDKVPAGDADHHYDSVVQVSVVGPKIIGTVISPSKTMRVWELWIDYVRDGNTGKSWQVCVGDNIDCQAISADECQSWAWDMEDGTSDAWNPVDGDKKTDTDMRIPLSDLTSAKNSYFSDAYGTVNVFCEDYEGNDHRFYSTSMNPSKKVKVFFPPQVGSVDPDAALSDSNPPCWYKFWRQEDMNGVMPVPKLDKFSWELGNPDPAVTSYGSSDFHSKWYWWDTITLVVCKGAGGTHYTNLVVNGEQFAVGATGIDCCAEVVAHEMTHNANKILKDVYDYADDDPAVAGWNKLGDMLLDIWEQQYSCNKANKDTHNVAAVKGGNYFRYGDGEYMAMKAAKGTKGVAAGDWSKGGKQW